MEILSTFYTAVMQLVATLISYDKSMLGTIRMKLEPESRLVLKITIQYSKQVLSEHHGGASE